MLVAHRIRTDGDGLHDVLPCLSTSYPLHVCFASYINWKIWIRLCPILRPQFCYESRTTCRWTSRNCARWALDCFQYPLKGMHKWCTFSPLKWPFMDRNTGHTCTMICLTSDHSFVIPDGHPSAQENRYKRPLAQHVTQKPGMRLSSILHTSKVNTKLC